MTLPFPSQQHSDFAAAATAPNLSAACFAGAWSTHNCGHNSRRTGTPLLKETRYTLPFYSFHSHGRCLAGLLVLLLLTSTASSTSLSMHRNSQGVELQTGNRVNIFCTFPGITPLLGVLLRSEIMTSTLTRGFSSEEGNN